MMYLFIMSKNVCLHEFICTMGSQGTVEARLGWGGQIPWNWSHGGCELLGVVWKPKPGL